MFASATNHTQTRRPSLISRAIRHSLLPNVYTLLRSLKHRLHHSLYEITVPTGKNSDTEATTAGPWPVVAMRPITSAKGQPPHR